MKIEFIRFIILNKFHFYVYGERNIFTVLNDRKNAAFK